MVKVCIKPSNDQCTINIPKEIVIACCWKNGDEILISKVPDKTHLIIENVTRGDSMDKPVLSRIEKLEQENAELKETIEILQDPEIMKKLTKKDKGKNISLEDMRKKLSL